MSLQCDFLHEADLPQMVWLGNHILLVVFAGSCRCFASLFTCTAVVFAGFPGSPVLPSPLLFIFALAIHCFLFCHLLFTVHCSPGNSEWQTGRMSNSEWRMATANVRHLPFAIHCSPFTIYLCSCLHASILTSCLWLYVFAGPHLSFAICHSPFAIRHSPFSPFAICHFAVRHSPLSFAIRHSPFVIRLSPFAFRRSPFAMCHSPFVICLSLFAIHCSLPLSYCLRLSPPWCSVRHTSAR
jgi:hypothetical protein